MPVFVCTRHSTAFDRTDAAFYNTSIRKQHILKATDAEVVRVLMKKIYPFDQEFCVHPASKEQIATVDLTLTRITCERCNQNKDYTDEFFFVSTNKRAKFCRQCTSELAFLKKTCPKCKKDKFMTGLNWFFSKDRTDGIYTPCKACYFCKRSKTRKGKKDEVPSESISGQS